MSSRKELKTRAIALTMSLRKSMGLQWAAAGEKRSDGMTLLGWELGVPPHPRPIVPRTKRSVTSGAREADLHVPPDSKEPLPKVE